MKIAIKTNRTVDITDLIPKFALFLDASIPVTINLNGNKISQWLDRSPNGFHATQTNQSSNYQPTYTSFGNFFGISHTSIGGLVSNSFLRITIPANFPAINGVLYVATNRYILPLTINIPLSGSARDFELVSGLDNILTGLILFNGVPTTNEDTRIINYLKIKGADLTTSTLTSLNMEFCTETSSSAYINPLLLRVENLSALASTNIDTSTVNNIFRAFRGLQVSEFPFINTSNVTNAGQAWWGNANLTAFPAIDLSKATNTSYSWYLCSNLVTFPAMDFRASTNFLGTWQNCRLNAVSVDNALISIAAGLANSPSKILAASGGSGTLLGANNSVPTNTKRRTGAWGTSGSGWNSWEFNLSQVNETILGITYDFRNGLSGLEAKAWLAAKGWSIDTR